MMFLKILAFSLIFVSTDMACRGQVLWVPTSEIPLSEVWALDMPGTKDIRELDLKKLKVPLSYLQTGPLDLLERLNKRHAEPAFVVEGTGQEALEAAHKQLPRQPKLNSYFLEKPNNQFPTGTELSVVFYSHPVGRACHIQKIERGGNNKILITYHFYPYESEAVTAHIALIPLGHLTTAGEYYVISKEVVLDKKLGIPPLRGIDTSSSVCRPSRFTIFPENKTEDKKEKTP